MGISDLQRMIESDPVLAKAGVSTVDIVKTAWTGRDKSGHGGSLSIPNRLALVMDAESCLDRLYGGYYSDWVCGGQWSHMLEFMSTLFQTMAQSNIHTATFINGTLDPARVDSWVAEQLKLKQNVKNTLRHLHKRGTPPPKVWWVPPTGVRSVVRLALRHLGLPINCTVDSHTLEVVFFLRENGYHGILGDHSDYTIFDPPRYFSAQKMKLTLKLTLETQEIDMDEVRFMKDKCSENSSYFIQVAKSFDLNPNRFSLMAALLGNHVLSDKDLFDFHKRLVPDLSPKTSAAIVIRAVVNYIRTLVNIDDVQALGVEIFGSPEDARVGKLKEVVDYYNAGSEDGYKKYKPAKKKKKVAIKVSPLHGANVSNEKDDENNDLLSEETEKTAERLANMVLSDEKETEDKVDNAKNPARDNDAAVEAVVTNNVKPSEDGKYPNKDKKTKPKEKASIPAVNSEVIKTAVERHRQGHMSPYLYNLLTTGEIMLPVLMEEEGGDLPNMHLVFRDLRKRVYGILFNLHHANFTRQKFEEEVASSKRKVEEIARKLAKVKPDSIVMKNNEPRSEREYLNEKMEAATAVVNQLAEAQPPDSAEKIIIREWTPYNRYQEPDTVSPLPLSWSVPTVQRLWFGTTVEDKQKRLRAFLAVMSSDTALMLNTSHVPQHLLLMASVLRYIMSQNNVLRKPELDAFLVTACSPELCDPQYLAKLKLDLVTSRGVQLASLFMEGVEMALFANDACGAPVPFLMSCPWLFFDGKLFHSKLRRAVGAKNLLEMCEHRMDIVMKVERMRTAILEGLVPDYNKPIPNLLAMGGMNRPMGPMWNNRGFPGGPMGGMGEGRGGQLIVAGSVVGQWGTNYGQTRGWAGPAQGRGTRGGKKNKEKKLEEVKKEIKEKNQEKAKLKKEVKDIEDDEDEDVKVMTVKEILTKDKNANANEE